MTWLRVFCFRFWKVIIAVGAIVALYPLIGNLFKDKEKRFKVGYSIFFAMILFIVWLIYDNSCEIPNLIGASYNEARIAFQELGLSIDGIKLYEDGSEYGEISGGWYVCGVRPDIGSIVKKGSIIELLLVRTEQEVDDYLKYGIDFFKEINEEIVEETNEELKSFENVQENSYVKEGSSEIVTIDNEELGYMLAMIFPSSHADGVYQFKTSDLNTVKSLFIVGQKMAFMKEEYIDYYGKFISEYVPDLCIGVFNNSYMIGDEEYPVGVIKNLNGIEMLRNIEAIHILMNPIEDITALKECTNLKSLSIVCGKLEDITPLQCLINMEMLELDSNQVSDIRALSVLSKIKKLSLCCNNISEISVVSNMLQLEELNIWNNNVSSIEALRVCTDLNTLCIPNNNISDISTLRYLKKIRWLSFGDNNIKDVSVLKELSELKTCYWEENPIENMEILIDLGFE